MILASKHQTCLTLSSFSCRVLSSPLLHLQVQGVQHALHLRLPVSSPSLRILLRGLLGILLNLLDLRLQLRLQLGVAACDLRTDDLAVPPEDLLRYLGVRRNRGMDRPAVIRTYGS